MAPGSSGRRLGALGMTWGGSQGPGLQVAGQGRQLLKFERLHVLGETGQRGQVPIIKWGCRGHKPRLPRCCAGWAQCGEERAHVALPGCSSVNTSVQPGAPALLNGGVGSFSSAIAPPSLP